MYFNELDKNVLSQPLPKKRVSKNSNKKTRHSTRHRLIRKYRDNYFMDGSFDDFSEQIQRFDIGYPSNICPFCNALKWEAEKKSMCCRNGKITLSKLPTPPKEMLELLNSGNTLSTFFLKHTRASNSALTMTSTQVNLAKFTTIGPQFSKYQELYIIILDHYLQMKIRNRNVHKFIFTMQRSK